MYAMIVEGGVKAVCVEYSALAGKNLNIFHQFCGRPIPSKAVSVVHMQLSPVIRA